jgi:MFS family permease
MNDVRERGLRRIPRTVWALGFVSLLMDTSSELIHSLLPVFLVGTLGASAAFVGLVEGVGEATAAISKVFSGWLSDRLGKRKLLAALGYGLAALTKPIFALAATPYEVLAGRFIDRVGKGVRGAPRDAMVADVTPPEVRGAAFGLRQGLDTVGAVAGPLLAMGLMVLLADNIRAVFWWSLVPGVLAVLVLVLAVKEPKDVEHAPAKAPIGWKDMARLGRPFWIVVGVGALFSLARFSEAFLILRLRNLGLGLALTPLVLIVMNLVYAASATPAGAISDRFDRRLVMAGGLVVLIVSDLILALSRSVPGALVGVGLWGLHLGLTQGLLSALVADAAPKEARGTAFGVFNLISGLALLAASGLAGLVWDRFGPAATFQVGGGFALATLAGLLFAVRRRS